MQTRCHASNKNDNTEIASSCHREVIGTTWHLCSLVSSSLFVFMKYRYSYVSVDQFWTTWYIHVDCRYHVMNDIRRESWYRYPVTEVPGTWYQVAKQQSRIIAGRPMSHTQKRNQQEILASSDGGLHKVFGWSINFASYIIEWDLCIKTVLESVLHLLEMTAK